jgi:hypothetical protein
MRRAARLIGFGSVLGFAVLLVARPGLCGDSSSPEQQADTRHWAYVKPVRPALPRVNDAGWPRNEVDFFVLSRLEQEGLEPSAPAERARLIRRVSLDLVGLPPTIEQVDAFVQDSRPDAYERVVEALLASPAYGEKWGRQWLDLARYADSNGFQRDGFRDVWAYRDWVIEALNRDMPFDQFTIEQIAGDLLPGATLEQCIATGFHRGTTVNVEAGVDQEANRINAVIDRVNTTGTVWLGTTIGCAQCHEHKYDPFTQADYYRLLAYFNNTEMETAFRGKNETAAIDFTGPGMELPQRPEAKARRQELERQRADLSAKLQSAIEEVTPRLCDWEQQELADKQSRKKLPAAIREVLAVPREQRSAPQAKQLTNYFVGLQPEVKALRGELGELREQIQALDPPTTLVMRELDEPRETHVFVRGNFQQKGERVTPGVPTALHRAPDDVPPNRLGLARWLVDSDNPLVARVTVNRWWAEFFGRGLVASLEDFGTQGERPTHPELLDWLATEFMRGGWSQKAIHRLIVTSSTYRQSSRVSADLLARDPTNNLYARGPRFRLDAETIRDNALAVSGLLCRKMGGPPVYPPQPPGIWRVTGLVDNTYRTSQSADRYRRGVYAIWRRSAPYPSFVNFDAPDRASCVVQRPRTNTPLQALTLMNDPVYVEMATALARRIISDCPDMTVRERVVYVFRLCLARHPNRAEVDRLEELYRSELERFEADPDAARALVQREREHADVEPQQLAAWFYVANVLLNLDETITKG